MSENRASRHFQNELGNEIDIDVSEGWGPHRIYGPKGMVMIRIAGPSSCSTNLITPMEAEKLREALNEWAGQ